MVVHSREEYEDRAVALASTSKRSATQPDTMARTFLEGQNEKILDLRRRLFLARDTMPLFDTERWVRNLEKGFDALWKRWVEGLQFRPGHGGAGCITVKDEDDTLLSFG
ncbi:hypothetical protein BDN67DRAFT_908669 [Paxillus ammoniavirescens]|nr:hypothetical protein BDN67DRAFT_908669 [Paxillus ammoniavirescens]